MSRPILPLNPSEFVVCAVGSSAFGPAGLATLGISYVWTMTRRNTLMPHAMGALRLAREIGRKRGLVWAMGAALAVGLVATGYTTLNLGYTHGGVNIDYPWFSNVNDAASPFDEFIGRRLLEPSPVFTVGFLYTALGTASCRPADPAQDAAAVVAVPSGRAAAQYGVVHGLVRFQRVPGVGNQGDHPAGGRGGPLQEGASVLYRNDPGRGHVLGWLVGGKRLYRKAENLAVHGLLELVVNRASGVRKQAGAADCRIFAMN